MYDNSETNNQLTIGVNDRRITRLGFFLRRYKLDELPQLLNVLKGEMSFVGPRPEVIKYVRMYDEDQKEVLNVRPGLTDFATLEYFNENEILAMSKNPEEEYITKLMPRKIELNRKFISDPSLRQYFRILYLTIRKIIISF
jgi:lipopolysaccharide/colanic/teichoic acid biosynthesis glycosyltransferase